MGAYCTPAPPLELCTLLGKPASRTMYIQSRHDNICLYVDDREVRTAIIQVQTQIPQTGTGESVATHVQICACVRMGYACMGDMCLNGTHGDTCMGI